MLIASEQVKDLGVIEFGKVYDFEIEITNTLGKDMIVNKVQVSCASCTKATLPRKIKGNESAKMKVTFTPGITGNTSKWIDVIYDTDQTLRVNFKAVVNG